MFETFCPKKGKKGRKKRQKKKREKEKEKIRTFLGGASMKKTGTQRADEREARESCERP